MPMNPPIAMPVPQYQMRLLATITVRSTTQETAGSFDITNGASYTVPCCLQPNSSSDASIYKRETGRTLYTCYLQPKASDGTALSTAILNHISSLAIDGVTYQVDGEALDLCSAGVVFQVNCSRET